MIALDRIYSSQLPCFCGGQRRQTKVGVVFQCVRVAGGQCRVDEACGWTSPRPRLCFASAGHCVRLFVSAGHPPVTATGALVAANTCTPILRPLCTCATGSTEVRESTERTEGGDDLHLLHCPIWPWAFHGDTSVLHWRCEQSGGVSMQFLAADRPGFGCLRPQRSSESIWCPQQRYPVVGHLCSAKSMMER